MYAPWEQRIAFDLWNRYTPDQYEGQYPNYANPLLMLNGDLDPQTPLHWADLASVHFQQDSFRYVVVPFSPHGTLFQAILADGSTCGLHMLVSFLESNGQDVDTSCINKVLPPDFGGFTNFTQSISQQYFGTPNLWN
jgi:hypothetical protein